VSTEFDCRLLIGSEYEAAIHELERIEAGGPDVVDAVRDRCLRLLEAGPFQKWHPAMDQYLFRAWQKELRSLRKSEGVSYRIAEKLIALAAMPDFQMSYQYGDQKSPNLVVLGDNDGGLYGVLCNEDAWFDSLFITRFSQSAAQFGVGRSMVVLPQDDVRRFYRTVANLGEDRCSGARAPEACWQTRERLLLLLTNCLRHTDLKLAISEAG
jgi:hypothetical protein